MWQPQGSYSQFLLRTPVLLCGKGAAQGLYNYPGERIAVIYGSSFNDEGKALFRQTFSKKDVCFIKRSWDGEPAIEDLSECVGELEEYRPDVFIAVGGGSVIDGVKLCRLFYEFPFFDVGCPRIAGSRLNTKFIAVPTTVGSGAEVSSAAVYWSKKGHRKEMAVSHALQPDVIVYDIDYIVNTPERVLYASALDGISHIMEGYVSNVKNNMAEMLGEKGLQMFYEAFAREGTINFERLQYAGYLGGIVQNHCIVGGAHAIAHQMTEFGFPHGEAVGLVLPSVIRVNCEDKECERKYDQLAGYAGFGDKRELISFIESILTKSGIAARRSEIKNVLERHFDSLVGNVKIDRGGKGNPVPITEEYVKKVIRGL